MISTAVDPSQIERIAAESALHFGLTGEIRAVWASGDRGGRAAAPECSNETIAEVNPIAE
jgi:hypothetical protein